jgi:hypothetical protein
LLTRDSHAEVRQIRLGGTLQATGIIATDDDEGDGITSASSPPLSAAQQVESPIVAEWYVDERSNATSRFASY